MKSLSLATLLLCFAASCHGAVVYVNANSSGPTQDGQSWKTAWSSLYDGLSHAAAGDAVWVAKGTYGVPVYYAPGYTLPSGVALLGGFLGNETNAGQRDPANNVTVLDGSGYARVVAIADNATSNTIVDGFTMQHGFPNYAPYNGYGAGIYIASGSPVVSNNVIQNNNAQNDGGGYGGGIYVAKGTPLIMGNVITSNKAAGLRTTAGYGGGIYVQAGTPQIIGNTISNNRATYGGGIDTDGGLIQDNVIADNSAGGGYYDNGNGGGIEAGTVTVVHNVFMYNSQFGSYGEGGAIVCSGGTITDNLFTRNFGNLGDVITFGTAFTVRNVFDGSSVAMASGTFSDNLVSNSILTLGPSGSGGASVVNNTFVDTEAVDLYAVYSNYRSGERPVLSNNVFTGWKGMALQNSSSGDVPPVFTVDHNDVYGNTSNTIDLPGASPVGQNGNISQDPLFVNASGGDYRLQQTSPCINTGNDAYVTAGDMDLDDRPRIRGSHVDMGPYEAVPVNAATFQQALRALRLAAGLGVASSADVTQLNVETAGASAGRVDLRDAVHLLRSADGLGS